mgnify:CR=1 FL=1
MKHQYKETFGQGYGKIALLPLCIGVLVFISLLR